VGATETSPGADNFTPLAPKPRLLLRRQLLQRNATGAPLTTHGYPSPPGGLRQHVAPLGARRLPPFHPHKITQHSSPATALIRIQIALHELTQLDIPNGVGVLGASSAGDSSALDPRGAETFPVSSAQRPAPSQISSTSWPLVAMVWTDTCPPPAALRNFPPQWRFPVWKILRTAKKPISKTRAYTNNTTIHSVVSTSSIPNLFRMAPPTKPPSSPLN